MEYPQSCKYSAKKFAFSIRFESLFYPPVIAHKKFGFIPRHT